MKEQYFKPTKISSPVPVFALQRKCACGRRTVGSGGECEECKEKRQGTLQRAAVNHSPTDDVPPIVHEVLRSSGQPLDTATRAIMEPRFGYDFGGVRMHTDAKAAESARAVQASAYTVGRDLVFGAGQYVPQTSAGQRLVAHELTHVVQQDARATPNRIELGQPHDRYEREADAQSLSASESRPDVPSQRPNHKTVPSRLAQRVLQRSLLGGILGGIGGAVGGALIGGLLGGPIGAVIGGVVGLVGGAIAGNAVSTESRALNSSEITYARAIFRDSIDYSKIRITRDSMYSVGAPLTIGNTIHLKSSWGHFKGDTLELTQDGLETLIHEMAHVWQYQNGGLAYIPQSLMAQFMAFISGGDRGGAYDWRAAHRERKAWAEWNPEQQASAIEDYNKLLGKSKDGTATVAEIAELSILVGYMQYVWRREGAPTFALPDMEDAPI